MKKQVIFIAMFIMLAVGCNTNDASSNEQSAPFQESAGSENSVESTVIDSGKPVAATEITAEITRLENGFSDTSVENTEYSETSSTVTENDRDEQSIEKEDNALDIEITVNGHFFSATLFDNETARAFKEQLPLTLDMSELNGNEKYYYLPDSLPTDSSRPSMINTGDIMLYGSSCLVIFYESFSTSYSYTPIGKVNDPDGLAAALGSGSVWVAFN